MNKQSNSTWNSLSDEFKQLITQRLGEPMARKIANIKNGKFKLNCAIANALLYDLNSMRDETLNLDLVYKLFPEIWPPEAKEPIFVDWQEDSYECITEDWTKSLIERPSIDATCKEVTPKEFLKTAVDVINECEEPAAEDFQQPAEVLEDPIFLIVLNHNGNSDFIRKLIDYCSHIKKEYPTQILTETEDIFGDRFTVKIQCTFTMLFKIAIDIDRFDPTNECLHGFSVQ